MERANLRGQCFLSSEESSPLPRSAAAEVVSLLVESGAEKDQPAMEGVTPLFAAAFSARFEVARFLVQASRSKRPAVQQ